jgi:hypothetical protein
VGVCRAIRVRKGTYFAYLHHRYELTIPSERYTEKLLPLFVLMLTRLRSYTDFQLTFAPTQFYADRPIWKAIIQLNVIGYADLFLTAQWADTAQIY